MKADKVPAEMGANKDDDEELDLRIYLAVLGEGKWRIVLSLVAFLFFGVLYAWVARPIYQADVLLQVEDTKGGSLGALDDLSSLMGGDASSDAEVEIIQSRKVLGAVVAHMGLEVLAKPHAFPLIGEAVSRRYSDTELAAPLSLSFLDGYAWGGESVQVKELRVPDTLLGKWLQLTVDSEEVYTLYGPEGSVLLHGRVGQPARVDGVAVFVSVMTARPGTRFDVKRLSLLSAINALQGNLSVQEKGKKTGVLSLTLQGGDRMGVANKANAIANAYLRQNVERRSEEARKSLAFIQQQIPDVKANMLAAELELNAYQLKNGSANLNLETQALLDKVVDIEQQRSVLSLQKADLGNRFTEQHPAIQVVESKMQQLEANLAQANQSIKKLPKQEQETLRLMRGVKLNTDLYTFLLNKAQELKVVEAGTIGNVRILDPALKPDKSIKPKRLLIVLLAMLAGGFFGVLWVLIRHAMQRGIEDASRIERECGLSVFVSIPYSEAQERLSQRLSKQRKGRAGTGGNYVLASQAENDLAVESLKSLRTNLHFALGRSEKKLVMMTGPAPGVGKSFVSVNLAQVLADGGQKVLLIDADMRKGHVNNYLGLERKPGLSELLSEQADLDTCIQQAGNLDLIAAGGYPPNPSELLMRPSFEVLITEVTERYDLVLIDTPPILAVTDAAVIGKYASVSFVLLRAGMHEIREVQQSIHQLERGGVKVTGAIFNGVQARAGYGYYGQYGYHYQYGYSSKGDS